MNNFQNKYQINNKKKELIHVTNNNPDEVQSQCIIIHIYTPIDTISQQQQ